MLKYIIIKIIQKSLKFMINLQINIIILIVILLFAWICLIFNSPLLLKINNKYFNLYI